VPPSAERLAHMGEAVEDLFIKELIPQASVEAFDEGILRRLTRSDVMPANAIFVLPFEHRAAGQLCSIVADDRHWLAVEADERIEFAGDAQA
jgi:hypothetical protein